MKTLHIELSPKPSKAEKAEKGLSGFVPVKTRWVIERSNALDGAMQVFSDSERF